MTMKSMLFAAVLTAISIPVIAQDPVSTPTPVTGQEKTPGIHQRQENQQARIKQGVDSGALTKGETRRLERQQGRIQADKLEAKSDGKVTKAERAQLTKEQNHASRNIYRAKHNGRTQ
jgi:hypothetical protein